MKPQSFHLASLILIASVLVVSCASPKEEVKPVTPEITKTPITPPPPPRVFRYEDRYYVREASIDKPTSVDDPLQALRVIQLKPGSNEVLVVSAFDKENVDGVERASETWFGIELPSFQPGTYDVAKAVKVMYYRFDLGEKGTRYDGKSYSGTVTVEEFANDALIGSFAIAIRGETRAFDKPNAPFTQELSGSFRIRLVPYEATIMKSRN